MNLRDFTNPDRAIALAWKLFFAILCLLALPQLIAKILPQFSAGQFLFVVLLWFLISPVAYLVRRHLQPRMRRPPPRRAVERTPLVPPDVEEE